MTQVQFERAFSDAERKVLTYQREYATLSVKDKAEGLIAIDAKVNKVFAQKLQDEALGQNIDIFV